MSPWDWRPPLGPWLELLADRLSSWRSNGIRIDRPEVLRNAALEAAAEGAHWLYHPALTAVKGSGKLAGMFSEAQFVGWIAAHLPGVDVMVDFDRPMQVWTAEGGASQVAGRLHVRDLASLVAPADGGTSAQDRVPLVLQRDDDGLRDVELVRRELRILLGTMPDIAAWTAGTVSVLDLLPPGFFPEAPSGALVSCSSPEVPGFIRVSRGADPLKLLEMVVHETAHQYLYRAEAAGPLIESSSNVEFSSPLRLEKRPLRGILLALHACANIAAAYIEAGKTGLFDDQEVENERSRVVALFESSDDIVAQASSHLTDLGHDFVSRTQKVADYARSR